MSERFSIVTGQSNDTLPDIEKEKSETPEQIREKMRDPAYLPSHQEVLKAFNWGRKYSGSLPIDEMQSAFTFNGDRYIYEFLNKEYIDALSSYLSVRAEILGASEEKPFIILEVGAGHGRLSHFLNNALAEKIPKKFKVIATDLREENLDEEMPVENIDCDAALKKYHPNLVISSWMPPGTDFTASIRAEKSVDEYLLIGETDDEVSGTYKTWDEDVYGSEGFSRKDLKRIEEFQICINDNYITDPDPKRQEHRSGTVSFKRNKKAPEKPRPSFTAYPKLPK